MPYVRVALSQTLAPEKVSELKAGIGQIIEIIPGKAEWGLMVEVTHGADLFFGGNPDGNAFAETRVHGECSREVLAEYTAALYGVVERTVGVPKERLYTNFTICDTWGAFGELH